MPHGPDPRTDATEGRQAEQTEQAEIDEMVDSACWPASSPSGCANI
jgi:hypothetical protein